jgi:NAD(P)-dependent dehydrogenase (short-subunit alcohol dehydrogenase family)
MRFEHCNVIVTGANSGIGLATTKHFLDEGARVLAVDINVAALNQLPVESLELDLATSDAPARIVSKAAQVFDSIDALINNAGVGGARTLELSDDAFIDRVLDINLRAVMRLTRDMLPLLRKPGASIVNVTSVYGETGYPGSAPYAASKGAISQLTRQLAADLAPGGIRVNGVAPGGTLGTDLRGLSTLGLDAPRLDGPDRATELAARNPLGVALSGADHAWSYVFLASDRARGISGRTVHSDGGMGIKV